MENDPKDIFKSLADTKPREKGGSLAQDRFNYQNCWALSQLLELHATGNDYVFAFEFHEDVLRLNSSTSPTEIYFCQVKTKEDGKWSIADLTARPKSKQSKKLSFIEKLYSNQETFPDLSAKLVFASNAHFSFLEHPGEIDASKIKDSDRKALVESLRKKYPSFSEDNLENIVFHVSHMPLGKHEEMVLGEIVKYFSSNLGAECAGHAMAWHTAIKKEIDAKNRVAPDEVKNREDLFKFKCLTREQIQETLNEVQNVAKIQRNWSTVSNMLTQEKVPAYEVFALQDGWNRFSMQQLDSTDTLLQDLILKLVGVIARVSDITKKSLMEIVTEGFALFKKENPNWSSAHPDYYIKAAIIWIVYERRIS